MPDATAHLPTESSASAGPIEGAEGAKGAGAAASSGRRRPKPGERRMQILQTLAAMLQEPGAERVTTAGLAARIGVSEAALYRHFASKAQMFEGLIEFIEHSVFSLVNQINDSSSDGPAQAARIVTMLLQFGERNPGMVRVMAGDALVYENERLQQRMNLFFDKIEAALRQVLRPMAQDETATVMESTTPSLDAQVRAAALTAFAAGRLQRYVRSGFKRLPTEHLQACLGLLLS